jgi:hypothetical protein
LEHSSWACAVDWKRGVGQWTRVSGLRDGLVDDEEWRSTEVIEMTCASQRWGDEEED